MTSSNFIDFIIAVFAMVLMLMAHKLVKSFLDHLFPGGGGHGPGALISGVMEGMGMEAGRKMLNMGTSAVKTGMGMMGSAGIAGTASALESLRKQKAFGDDGFVGGPKANTVSSPLSDKAGLYPGALPPGDDNDMEYLPPNGFTMPDMEEESFAEASSTTSSATGQSTSGDTATSSTGSASTAGATTRPSSGSRKPGIFDNQSALYGARTQLRPSATNRMTELNTLADGPARLGEAFVAGAGRRLAADAKHKVFGERGKYAGGASGLMGVAKQEFGSNGVEGHKVLSDSYLPSSELMKAARTGDQFAVNDMAKVGQHQQAMDQGIEWYEQGLTLQSAIQPDYDNAKSEYDEATQELQGLSVIKHQYEASGNTGSAEYQQISSQYDSAVIRQQTAQTNFKSRESQMQNATDMVSRGEQRIISSQNAISKINTGWYSEKQQNSERMLQAAYARASRTTLSDLGATPGGRKR